MLKRFFDIKFRPFKDYKNYWYVFLLKAFPLIFHLLHYFSNLGWHNTFKTFTEKIFLHIFTNLSGIACTLIFFNKVSTKNWKWNSLPIPWHFFLTKYDCFSTYSTKFNGVSGKNLSFPWQKIRNSQTNLDITRQIYVGGSSPILTHRQVITKYLSYMEFRIFWNYIILGLSILVILKWHRFKLQRLHFRIVKGGPAYPNHWQTSQFENTYNFKLQ